MNRRLPVTLVGGFLGAGKTSLLHHFISEHQSGNLAILVENPGALNLDAKAIKGLCGAMRRLGDTVMEMPSLEESAQIDLLADKLRELSENGRFERVLVETSGTVNAASLEKYFGISPSDKDKFTPWAELHQIVCVVDALDLYHAVIAPMRRGEAVPFLDFQQAQIKDAGMLVLNKCDLVNDAERAACVEFLLQVNAKASLVEAAYGEVPTEIWAQIGRFQPSLQQEPSVIEAKVPDVALSSVLYRAYRPFHPARFWDWFNAEHPGLLRAKGLIWLATRNLLVGGISRTRFQNGCGGAGIWWAALPREEWPQESDALTRMQETWREPYGDRRQELVLIGEAARLAEVTRGLDACLLNAEEYDRPTREWTAFPDPFPIWDVGAEGA